ncbi:MAG: HDIG domain-containing protein [Puniceicoccales bacterium]|jgi:putative nucleotidyltransferase with HDIG domain|nr:HDIG domain-containing protein [Puniceicoccales bacterium]
MGFPFKKHRGDNPIVKRVLDETDKRHWYRSPAAIAKGILLAVLATVFALICFWGRPAHLPILLPDSTPKVRYEAQFDFEYTSYIQTARLRASARRRVAPVYIVSQEKTDETLAAYQKFLATLEPDLAKLRKLTPAERVAEFQKRATETVLPGIPGVAANALSRLMETVADDAKFFAALREARAVLKALLERGVRPRNTATTGGRGRRLDVTGTVDEVRALRDLHRNLDPIALRTQADPPGTVRDYLLAFFRPGIVTNVRIDEAATEQSEAEAEKKVVPVRLKVTEGELLLQPGERATPSVLERWNAYRAEMSGREKIREAPLRSLEENAAVAGGVALLFALFLHICPLASERRRSITLAIVAAAANLLLIRLFLEIGEKTEVLSVFGGNEIFFWFSPPALAAIVTAILGGVRLAILAAFLVSIFATLMLGRSVDVFLIFALASLAGIYCCRRVRDRGTVFRAGLWVGIVVAAAVLLICLAGKAGWREIAWQVAGCFASGLGTSALVLVMLPALEKVFKTTSDITLIELADTNQPLLRKLQLIAPGTSIHSANVATIADAAAAAIGANSLLCRCAALFHDIGKMSKPEYFVENQGAENPHDKITPTMSALIIRGHVGSGVQIAREYKLPRDIIDIILQHHGTDLIKGFYYKAKKLAETDGSAVDAETFRYEGPRPHTREAAIVMLADGLEAASRALPVTTPQSIRELVDSIVATRIADGQLDESPLTFRELEVIRESMEHSLTTMYHHRVQYPKEALVKPKNTNEPDGDSSAAKTAAPAASAAPAVSAAPVPVASATKTAVAEDAP